LLLALEDEGTAQCVLSDVDWQCREAPGWHTDTPERSSVGYHVEIYDARCADAWRERGLDAAGWNPVTCVGTPPAAPWGKLVPRGLRHSHDRSMAHPTAVVAVHEIQPGARIVSRRCTAKGIHWRWGGLPRTAETPTPHRCMAYSALAGGAPADGAAHRLTSLSASFSPAVSKTPRSCEPWSTKPSYPRKSFFHARLSRPTRTRVVCTNGSPMYGDNRPPTRLLSTRSRYSRRYEPAALHEPSPTWGATS
jgi:hypothetical protein